MYWSPNESVVNAGGGADGRRNGGGDNQGSECRVHLKERPTTPGGKPGCEVMSTDEVCAYTGFSRAYIGQQMRVGALRAKKHGNRWRTTRDHVDNWVAESRERSEESNPLITTPRFGRRRRVLLP